MEEISEILDSEIEVEENVTGRKTSENYVLYSTCNTYMYFYYMYEKESMYMYKASLQNVQNHLISNSFVSSKFLFFYSNYRSMHLQSIFNLSLAYWES